MCELRAGDSGRRGGVGWDGVGWGVGAAGWTGGWGNGVWKRLAGVGAPGNREVCPDKTGSIQVLSLASCGSIPIGILPYRFQHREGFSQRQGSYNGCLPSK